jgi:hypothetical protein
VKLELEKYGLVETAAKKVAYVPSIANGCLGLNAAVKGSAELAQTKTNHVAFAVEKAGSAMRHVAGTSGLRAKEKAFVPLVLSKKRRVGSAASVPEIAPASVSGANGAPALGRGYAVQTKPPAKAVGTVELPL